MSNKLILEKYLKNKIGIRKYNKLSKKQNLIKNNSIDSLDLADIHSFISNKFKKKINLKTYGRNFNVSLINIFKFLK